MSIIYSRHMNNCTYCKLFYKKQCKKVSATTHVELQSVW